MEYYMKILELRNIIYDKDDKYYFVRMENYNYLKSEKTITNTGIIKKSLFKYLTWALMCPYLSEYKTFWKDNLKGRMVIEYEHTRIQI